MSATAVTTPKSARDAAFTEQDKSALLQPDVNLNAPRYFVQFGFSTVSVPTQAIPNATMRRGDIVLCRTTAVIDNYWAIPETERIPGSEQTGADGRLAVASRRSYAFYEAEQLLMNEDKSERKNCIFEIRALRSELGDRVYRLLDLTRLFFPEWPALPEKNIDVLALLEKRIGAIADNLPAGIPSELQSQVAQILRNVGEELIEAARKTQDIQRQEILYTHQCMKLRPSDERYRPRYDSRDIEILARTGLPQIDAAELQTAESLGLLARQATGQGSDNTALLKLVEAQQEANALLRAQLEQQGQALQALLAERKPTRTKQPAGE
jgi:hypothetical protein